MFRPVPSHLLPTSRMIHEEMRGARFEVPLPLFERRHFYRSGLQGGGTIPAFFRRSHRSGSASDFLYLAPEAITNRSDRDTEQLSNFLPLVFRGPKRQYGGISLAELSNDLFEIQPGIYLTDPSIVCGVV